MSEPTTIEQVGLDDYYLYSSFTISDEDLSIDIDYSPASTISGTILAYTVEFDENWTADDIAANTTNAQNLDVNFVSGDVIFATVTDSEGNFTIVVPGDLDLCNEGVNNCKLLRCRFSCRA